VLLACQGQLRLAPNGHVVGIDMDAAFSLASARGYDLAVLSELLPAAEAGLVEAVCSDRVRDDGPGCRGPREPYRTALCRNGAGLRCTLHSPSGNGAGNMRKESLIFCRPGLQLVAQPQREYDAWLFASKRRNLRPRFLHGTCPMLSL